MEPTIEGAQRWLDRAAKHIDELSEITRRLADVELEQLRERIEIQHHPEDPPSVTIPHLGTDVTYEVGILVGEALQAFRRALDYLVFELACLDSGSEQRGTQFPADHSRKVFEKRGEAGMLIGISDGHMAALGRYQPFSLEGWVQRLVDYSNPDKHRRLSVAVNRSQSRIIGSGSQFDPEITRDGDVLEISFRTDHDSYAKLRVSAFVAFDDGESVEDTLRQFHRNVAYVLEDFEPCFWDECPHRTA